MAQIMRYHQWPQKGTGLTPSYTKSSNQLKIESVNLANTMYDWDNMLPVYNESSTFEEKMADLTSKLAEQMKESAKLDEEIKKVLGAIGYEI